MSDYTYDDVSTAVNGAADMLTGLDPDTQTLVDFVVNATLTLIKQNDATVADVLEVNWDDSETREMISDIVTGS